MTLTPIDVARLAISSIGSFDRGLQQHYENQLEQAIKNAKPAPSEANCGGWISVKERLPEREPNSTMSAAVLVIHRDRPDYPVTAHAVLGDCLGLGIGISTNGASKYPEIAWHSIGRDLCNPFDLAMTPDKRPFKDSAGYSKFMPRYFGAGITHWMPIPKAVHECVYRRKA